VLFEAKKVAGTDSRCVWGGTWLSQCVWSYYLSRRVRVVTSFDSTAMLDEPDFWVRGVPFLIDVASSLISAPPPLP